MSLRRFLLVNTFLTLSLVEEDTNLNVLQDMKADFAVYALRRSMEINMQDLDLTNVESAKSFISKFYHLLVYSYF
jgi:hypothetical protein